MIKNEIENVFKSNGFKVFETGKGVVRFEGSEFDLIRAFEISKLNGFNPFEGHRVYRKDPVHKNDNTPEVKEIGEAWQIPFNEIVFTDKGFSFLGE